MPDHLKPPYHADHVGSLLRPSALQAARAAAKKGEMSGDALREVEDRYIREVVTRQEAAKFMRLEDLCLSPQCGFSSTHYGNAPTEAGQWRKLDLIVEVLGEV